MTVMPTLAFILSEKTQTITILILVLIMYHGVSIMVDCRIPFVLQ